MAEVTRESIIEAARTAAAQQQRPLTRADFSRLTGIGPFHLYRCFPDGGWSEVQELAGIARHPHRREHNRSQCPLEVIELRTVMNDVERGSRRIKLPPGAEPVSETLIRERR